MKSIIISTLLLASFNAFATTLIRSAADWALYESDAAANVCFVSTNNTNPGGDDHFPNQESQIVISISKYKNNPDMPVEIMLQFSSNLNASTGVVASASGGPSIALADMDGRKSSFWGIPKNLSALIERLKSNSTQFKVKTVGGRRSEDLKLSTRGFNDMLKEMETRCNGGAPLVNQEFESGLLASAPDSIDPTKIDSAKTSQLRGVYFAAYKASAGITANKYALANILVKYQPLIDELKVNRDQASSIQNVSLPAVRSTLADAQKQQVDASAEIAQINAKIPELTAKIAGSQKKYDAAKAVIAPLVPEHDRITGSLSSAQSTLSESQNRLAYIDTRLRDGAQQISSLDYEASTIEQRLPQKRSDLDRARSALRDAESRRANFNVSWERDSRLRNNFEYSRLQSDRQNTQNNLRQIEMELQRLRMDRDRAAGELQQCRSQPVPPPPQAPADCSQFEQALNSATMWVSQRENDQRNLANRINDINSRLYQIERQVDMDVRREYDNLVYTEDQARRTFDRIDRDVSADQNRLSQIRSSDIPRLEREQSQLQSERPTVVARISDATSAVERLTQELARFNSANDWDRKAAAVDATGNQLASDQEALRLAESNKAQAERRLQSFATVEAQAKAQINTLNSQLSALNQRAAVLDDGLKQLPAERASLDAAIAAGQTELASRKTQFLELLK